jgi:tRNA (cytidine/uridine-2'-O-)-methyltransferase
MSTAPPTAEIHVVLVEPEIHWNTGNAGRTCLAAGARLHLVAPLGFSLAAKELRRAGLDYWPAVRPCLWPDWATFESHLPALGSPYFFSAEAERDLWQADYRQPAVLIFGSESRGLPAAVRQRYREHLVAIPQAKGAVRSLNQSSAVAIALYEVRRRSR